MKKVTIIMVAYKHFEETKKALESLAENTNPADYKLIFFDSCMEPKEESWVIYFCKDKGIELKYQGATYNRGWITCINNGYAMCDTEFALTVHNDVIFPKYWLSNMMRRFDDPKVAAVGPVISFAMGAQAQANAYQLMGCNPKFLLGLFFLCRMSVLEEIKVGSAYLAKEYGMGDKEELELCHRIRQLGYKFKIAYDVLVQHTGEKGFVDLCGSAEEFHKYQEKKLELLKKRLGEEVVKDIFTIDLSTPIRIMIGMLTRDTHVHHLYAFSLLKIWGATPVFKDVFHIGRGHPIDRAVIIKEAIKAKCTHVVLIDDDMIFDGDAVTRLLTHDVDFVTGMAFQRGKPHAPCIFLADSSDSKEDKWLHLVDAFNMGVYEIDACGAFFMLVKIDAIKNMKEPYFVYGDQSLGYGGKDGIGEDIYFSLKAKLSGAKLWCDSDLIIGHLGPEEIITEKHFIASREAGAFSKKEEKE